MAFQATPKTLAQWLSTVMNDPEKTWVKDGKTVPAALVAIRLVHNSTGGEREVDGVTVGANYDDERVLKLAERFLGRADAAIAGLSGHQQFTLFAFYEGSSEPQTFKTFSRNAHLVNDTGDASSEPPTVEGRLQQRMRHDEAYSQMLITGNANLINAQNRFMELQAARLEKATQENMLMFDHYRDMLMQQATANHEHKMAEMNAQRTNAMVEGAVKLAPALLNRLTGTEIVPHSTEDTAILSAIADAITAEDLPKLTPLLNRIPQAAQGLFFSRLTEIQEQKEARKKALAEALEKNETAMVHNGAANHELEH